MNSDGIDKVVKTALQEVEPFFMGADAATEAAANGVEKLADTTGMIGKKVTNAAAVMAGDALQGIGATVGAVPSGLYHIVKQLQKGILGRVLSVLLGRSSSSSSEHTHRKNHGHGGHGGNGRKYRGRARNHGKNRGPVASSSSKKLVVVHGGSQSDSNSNRGGLGRGGFGRHSIGRKGAGRL